MRRFQACSSPASSAVPSARSVVSFDPSAGSSRFPAFERVIKVDAAAIHSVALKASPSSRRSTWAAMQGRTATSRDVVGRAGGRELARTSRDNSALRSRRRDVSSIAMATSPPALASAARTIDAVYEIPFLAHVPMEPVHYLADVRADRADMWGSTQAPENVAQRVAALTGLKPDAITVHLSRSVEDLVVV